MTVQFLLQWLTKKAKSDLRFVAQMLADCARSVSPAPLLFDPVSWSDDAVHIGWVGHACVLIKMYGITILTDPTLSARVGPNIGPFVFGPKRYVLPGLENRKPRVDLVLVSHSHFDHMDLRTLRSIVSTRFLVAPKHTQDILAGAMAEKVIELQWGRTLEFHLNEVKISVSAFPVKHNGARWRHDTYRACNGYLISCNGVRIAFVGDTAFDQRLSTAVPGSDRPDVVIVPIGSYDPYERNHCTPEQALRVAEMLGSRFVVPIHHKTFRLSRERLNEPLDRFLSASAITPIARVPLEIGGHWVMPST